MKKNVEQILYILIPSNIYHHYLRRGLNLSCGQTRALNLPSMHSCRIKRPSSESPLLKSISSRSCPLVIRTLTLKQLDDSCGSGCTTFFLPNQFPINYFSDLHSPESLRLKISGSGSPQVIGKTAEIQRLH